MQSRASLAREKLDEWRLQLAGPRVVDRYNPWPFNPEISPRMHHGTLYCRNAAFSRPNETNLGRKVTGMVCEDVISMMNHDGSVIYGTLLSAAITIIAAESV